jgi:serine/threonine protein kinase
MVQHEHNVITQKGTFISAGLSGIVELLPSGQISKSPHPGALLGPDSRREIANEARIYAHLGPHPRLVPMEGYTEDGLLLQYMPHGNLADYLHTHSKTIPMSQRLRWAC